jgi:hypothetical protein
MAVELVNDGPVTLVLDSALWTDPVPDPDGRGGRPDWGGRHPGR